MIHQPDFRANNVDNFCDSCKTSDEKLSISSIVNVS